ncbi:MAG: dTDP-4-dehydrorhamnose 3,5-epimerase [Candidatus Micrarchaeia archaeon]|jgi:dTDP-4-dehydrorhamnose 3,5-epimerase
MTTQQNEAVDLPLAGAFLIKPYAFDDERGAFRKIFTEKLLSGKGVSPFFSEQFLSVSKKGVVRGLHYQRAEFSQARLVWCPSGKVFDVIVDLRKSSETYGKCASAVLSGRNMHALYVPRGFAHGFMALSANATMVYQADNAHSPQNERGIIFSDPALGIKWPSAGKVTLSEKDSKWPTFKECEKFD